MSGGWAPCRIELQVSKVETLRWIKGKCPLGPKTYKALLSQYYMCFLPYYWPERRWVNRTSQAPHLLIANQ